MARQHLPCLLRRGGGLHIRQGDLGGGTIHTGKLGELHHPLTADLRVTGEERLTGVRRHRRDRIDRSREGRVTTDRLPTHVVFCSQLLIGA